MGQIFNLTLNGRASVKFVFVLLKQKNKSNANRNTFVQVRQKHSTIIVKYTPPHVAVVARPQRGRK